MTSGVSLKGILLLIVLHMRTATAPDTTTVASTVSDTTITSSASTDNSATITSTTNTTDGINTTSSPFPPPGFGNSSKISCPMFTCNFSSCLNTLMNSSYNSCMADTVFCKVKLVETMKYWVGCSSSCNTTGDWCGNQTTSNCTVKCCTSSDCLNSTLSSMLMTTAGTTSATTVTATTTVSVATTATTAKSAKKCSMLKCVGEKCYQTLNPKPSVMDCLTGQDFCYLKKTVSGSNMTWEASCGVNCMSDKACSSTAVDCTQECCNATTTGSCLKLDGTLVMASSSASIAGPTLTTLAIALLAWALGRGSFIA